MVLKRPELCRVTGFNSWTDIELWIRDIVATAYHELVEDYLKAFKDRGEKDPGGNGAIKEYFVRFAYDIEKLVTKRAAEMQSGHSGQEQEINKERWLTMHHYKRFMVEALALDRVKAASSPDEKNTISSKAWAANPITLFANMYELTDALCHNYWKPADSDWDPDDSDVPFTDPADPSAEPPQN
ncbi:uncharacterized protein THITE_2048054 [Thermothielavioides terrestris NRRL 8126]|uniref:Uncharacterized protein n=1 Tax=Thermothielavioides terrestris (strain ATCC 38088 / NRRL 8126) TaxID=578455 RepID=G2QYA0_THETT|nr:uncharacterized protein THITE_2048054 [Thermothielavioides terrestris NRRL 8126]AEO66198.1 hypothetical protein THITE_2048054 [Thermothielavioides terrestris NRRL 8126]